MKNEEDTPLTTEMKRLQKLRNVELKSEVDDILKQGHKEPIFVEKDKLGEAIEKIVFYTDTQEYLIEDTSHHEIALAAKQYHAIKPLLEEMEAELKWLKDTAEDKVDRARVIGYEDCYRKIKVIMEGE